MLPLCRGVSLYLPLLVLLPLQLHGADAQAGSDNAVAATAQAQRELRSAAGSGDLVLLASAIQRGAKVDYKKGDGTTPLSEAARKGQAAAVVALLEAGATVDLRAAGQMTALMSAARLVDTAAMRALLAAGADPNLQAPNGWTALMYAAKDARRDGVAMLLESGADRTLKSASGKTALQWAQESGAPGVAEVVAMLESGGSAANGTSAEYVRCETQAWDLSGSGGAGGFVSGSFTLEMHR